jgi:hypothetical protein
MMRLDPAEYPGGTHMSQPTSTGGHAAAVPYDTLRDHRPLTEALDNLDGSLLARREWALNDECTPDERQAHAAMYSATLHEMRVMIGTLRDTLPVQETRDAYAQLVHAGEPENSPASAQAWARANAAERLDQFLDAVNLLLPLDSEDVVDRARAATD